MAKLAASVPTSLDAWRVPITDFLVGRSVLEVNRDHPELIDALAKELARYRTSPPASTLSAWLGDRPKG